MIANIDKLKRKTERLKYGSVWSAIKRELLHSPSVSISVAVALLLIGGYIAAIINYISTSDEALIRFILSSSFSFFILLVGFLFFLPFWKFRRKYYFLEEQDDNTAARLVMIYNRSKQALTSFDGINAVQFFKIETHTNDRHVLYSFRKVFSFKSKHFTVSRLKSKELKVPISLFEWLKLPSKPAPDHGEEINELLYEWLERRSNDDEKFVEIIDDWSISFRRKPKIMSIHYHVLFEPKESINADNYKEALVDKVDPVFLMEYNGIKEYHEDRQYYSVRIYFNDSKEGIQEGLLLIIGNKRRMDTKKVNQIVSGILNNEGDENVNY